MHRIARRIKAVRKLQAVGRSPYNLSHQLNGDLYQFGVFTGGGLKTWVDAMPTFNISFSQQLWGFDSFIGMPYEANASLYQKKTHLKNPSWQPGGLNASAVMQASDWPSLRTQMIRNIGYSEHKAHLIKGFYNESLVDGAQLARRLGMRPALLVDIDCDLYSSSKQALEFMLEAGLLVKGSFIYYDDISDKDFVGVTQRGDPGIEESLAHMEVAKAWGIRWRQLPALGVYPGPMGGSLAWIHQFPNSTTRSLIPPELYSPTLELQYCKRCERIAAARAAAGSSSGSNSATQQASSPQDAQSPPRTSAGGGASI